MSDGSTRHVLVSVIESYFSQGLDGVLGIAGNPAARLLIAPGSGQLGIRLPVGEAAPDVSGFANITIDLVDDEDASWQQMSVQIEDNLSEVYAMLCNIVDRVQLANTSFSNAVEEVLDSLAEILARRRGLSDDQQVGLAGELLTLTALVEHAGHEQALDSWRGPLGEEHDFGLPDCDLEVKVTLGERRQHWISSLTQLVPTGDRNLYLLSIQLTAAGAGKGWSLPSLVDQVRRIAKSSRVSLDVALDNSGYRDLDSDLYPRRWTLRSPPVFLLVANEFPVISRPALENSVASTHRVVDVRYRIDLTGLPTSQPLFPFADQSKSAR